MIDVTQIVCPWCKRSNRAFTDPLKDISVKRTLFEILSTKSLFVPLELKEVEALGNDAVWSCVMCDTPQKFTAKQLVYEHQLSETCRLHVKWFGTCARSGCDTKFKSREDHIRHLLFDCTFGHEGHDLGHWQATRYETLVIGQLFNAYRQCMGRWGYVSKDVLNLAKPLSADPRNSHVKGCATNDHHTACPHFIHELENGLLLPDLAPRIQSILKRAYRTRRDDPSNFRAPRLIELVTLYLVHELDLTNRRLAYCMATLHPHALTKESLEPDSPLFRHAVIFMTLNPLLHLHTFTPLLCLFYIMSNIQYYLATPYFIQLLRTATARLQKGVTRSASYWMADIWFALLRLIYDYLVVDEMIRLPLDQHMSITTKGILETMTHWPIPAHDQRALDAQKSYMANLLCRESIKEEDMIKARIQTALGLQRFMLPHTIMTRPYNLVQCMAQVFGKETNCLSCFLQTELGPRTADVCLLLAHALMNTPIGLANQAFLHTTLHGPDSLTRITILYLKIWEKHLLNHDRLTLATLYPNAAQHVLPARFDQLGSDFFKVVPDDNKSVAQFPREQSPCCKGQVGSKKTLHYVMNWFRVCSDPVPPVDSPTHRHMTTTAVSSRTRSTRRAITTPSRAEEEMKHIQLAVRQMIDTARLSIINAPQGWSWNVTPSSNDTLSESTTGNTDTDSIFLTWPAAPIIGPLPLSSETLLDP